jgi:hypothetical protein
MIQNLEIKWNNGFAEKNVIIIKHYRFLMCGFCIKLMCLFTPIEMTENSTKTLAYYRTCPFTF